MEVAASGVRPNWFNDVFVQAFKDLEGKPNELKDEYDNVIIKERYVGVTTEQLAEKTKMVYGGLKPSSGDLLNKFLLVYNNWDGYMCAPLFSFVHASVSCSELNYIYQKVFS
jgi:hypothetical protein